MHRPALAAADAGRAAEQLGHEPLHRGAAQQRVDVAAVRAVDEVVGAQRRGEPGGDGLLAEREVRRPLHETLQEQVVDALLEQARLDHHPVHVEPRGLFRLGPHRFASQPSVLVRDHQLFAGEERDDPRGRRP